MDGRWGQGSGVRWYGLVLCALLAACAQQRAPVVSRTSEAAAEQPAPQGRVHVVARGDTLYAIAWRYDTTVAELARINGLGPPYLIRVGDRLRVDDPAVSRSGPAGAAAAVASPVAAPSLATGAGPAVRRDAPTTTPAPPLAKSAPVPLPSAPGAAPPPPPTQPSPPPSPPPASDSAADRSWRWPAEGRITRQYDSNRAFKGINIQSRSGTGVRAAAPGEVVYAGDGLRGYGQLIIVKHDDLYLSAYAHNRVMKVREGERVAGGQVIGEVGGDAANPGRLYFEIRKEGKPIDPTRLLPAQ